MERMSGSTTNCSVQLVQISPPMKLSGYTDGLSWPLITWWTNGETGSCMNAAYLYSKILEQLKTKFNPIPNKQTKFDRCLAMLQRHQVRPSEARKLVKSEIKHVSFFLNEGKSFASFH
jgi:hypothetical protein